MHLLLLPQVLIKSRVRSTAFASVVKEKNHRENVLHSQGGGGGGGTLNFSLYVGWSPASTLHPQKYHEFQTPQKIIEILATQTNILILYNDLKKSP